MDPGYPCRLAQPRQLSFAMDHDDLLLLRNLASRHQLEIDEEDKLLDRVHLITAVLIVGSNEDHAWSIENQRPRRQYLGWMSLLPNPRIGTPWMRLYENHDDWYEGILQTKISKV